MLTPIPSQKQKYVSCVAFDVLEGTSKAQLATLMKTLTVGLGSRMFDQRFGLAASKPRKLTPMKTFPNDALEDAWSHGDLMLQVRADYPDAVHHAVRDITRHTRGGNFWERVSINEQEGMFGRRRDSGAPLDGNTEFDTPNYRADPHGTVIPLDSHIRMASPRTPATANQQIVRRPYNYDLGVDLNGNMQAGHLFIAYQQDLQRQFETIQKRLIDEPLIDYVQPFGGGYFYTLPGVAGPTDWYASRLLT